MVSSWFVSLRTGDILTHRCCDKDGVNSSDSQDSQKNLKLELENDGWTGFEPERKVVTLLCFVDALCLKIWRLCQVCPPQLFLFVVVRFVRRFQLFLFFSDLWI